MKYLAIPIFFLLVSCELFPGKESEYGYVLFDVYLMDEGVRKNYWLGVYNGIRVKHLYSRSSVHKVYAGTYRVTHLDRNGDFCMTYDDLNVEDEFPEFEVKAGVINYLGVVTLKAGANRDSYQLNFHSGGGLMQRACAENPEIFQVQPIRFALSELDDRRQFKYECATNSVVEVTPVRSLAVQNTQSVSGE